MADGTDTGLPRSKKINGRFTIPWKCDRLPPNKLKFVYSKLIDPDNGQVPSREELSDTLPVVIPDRNKLQNPPSSGVQVTWLGHATVLIQMEDISVLTDPMFSTRCSPVQFAGPVRYREVPCSVEDLPVLHAIVISHNHYDHLDLASVHKLNARFGSKLCWYVPLGLEQWMKTTGRCENVKELDWWQTDSLPSHPHIKFVFTPAQHWSARGFLDTNRTLWGSWCILGKSTRAFFAGDTGYCDVFKKIGKKLGPFHFAAIPIGAYEPRWFMCPQHVDPEEAVQIHMDLQCTKSLGIHWGTFKLSNEFYLAPREKLTEFLTKMGLNVSDFFTLNHGQTTHIE